MNSTTSCLASRARSSWLWLAWTVCWLGGCADGGSDAPAGAAVAAKGIRAEPATIAIRDAAGSEQITVWLEHEDGSRRDISAGAEGTVYMPLNSGVVRIGADGEVSAIGIGSTTLRISNGGFTALVPAEVDVPPRDPAPQAAEAVRQLRDRRGADVRVRYDARTGLPASLLNLSGHLSEPSALPPLEILLGFLESQASLYGLPPAELDRFELTSQFTSQHTGITHLTLEQRYQGLVVYNSRIRGAIDGDGRIINVVGAYHPGVDLVTQPGWTAREALVQAIRATDPGSDLEPETLTGPEGAAMEHTFGRGPYADDHSARLVVFPLPLTARFRLCWQVELRMSASGQYLIHVDALDGEVLSVANSADDYTSDTTGGLIFESNPDAGTQVWRSFNGDPEASPQGWIMEGMLPSLDRQLGQSRWSLPFSTYGLNVIAGGQHPVLFGPFPDYNINQDHSDFSFPFQNRYELSGGTDPETDWNAGITNAFYWANLAHDRYHALGFDEPAGNFQLANHDRGGIGNDPVLVFVQLGWDEKEDYRQRNNAYFSTSPEGEYTSVLTLLLFTDPPHRDVDPAFCADLILHECTHGLSSRLCGGPFTRSADVLESAQANAMSEGWSDWFAASILDDPVFGEYMVKDSATGIRGHALDANPLTYGDIGWKGYVECHADGEIWSATLWDLRAALIERHGKEPGVRRAEQIVVDAMKLSPAEPTMLDMRDYIILADRAGYDGEDVPLIWDVFARRGMGLSARTTGPGDTDPEVASDVPPLPTAEIHATPTILRAGDAATLRWSTENATSVTLEPEIGAVEPVGDLQVSPPETTVYTLIVSGLDGVARSEVTVNVLPAGVDPESVEIVDDDFVLSEAAATRQLQVLCRFTDGQELDVTASDAGTLYESSDATVATVSADGLVTAMGQGTADITATFGSMSDSVEVTVDTSAPRAPTVLLTATPGALVQGASITLAWESSDSTEVTIDPSIGAVDLVGSIEVSPEESVTYTATAVGPGGRASMSVAVAVVQVSAMTVGGLASTGDAPVALSEGSALITTLGPDGTNFSPDDSVVLLQDLGDSNRTTRLQVGSLNGDKSVAISRTVAAIQSGGGNRFFQNSDDLICVLNDLETSPRVVPVSVPFLSGGIGDAEPLGPSSAIVGTIGPDATRGTADDRLAFMTQLDGPSPAVSYIVVGGLSGFEASRPVALSASSAVVFTEGPDGVRGTADDTIISIRELGSASTDTTPLTVGGMSGSTVCRPVKLSVDSALVSTEGPDSSLGTPDDTVVLLRELGGEPRILPIEVGGLMSSLSSRPVALSPSRALVATKGPDGEEFTGDDLVVLLADLDTDSPRAIPITLGGLGRRDTFRPQPIDLRSAIVSTSGADLAVGTADDSVVLLTGLDTDEPRVGEELIIGGLSGSDSSRPVLLSPTRALVLSAGPDGDFLSQDDEVVLIDDLGGADSIVPISVPYLSASFSISLPVALSDSKAVLNSAGPDGELETVDDEVALIHLTDPPWPIGCFDFVRREPGLGVERRIQVDETHLAFEYTAGPDASTEVSFEIHLNGSHIANAGPVPRREASGEIVLPDNIVRVGENLIELRDPTCTVGVGSCGDGSLVSWGGRVCIAAREPFDAVWFERNEPPFDVTTPFLAEDRDYTLILSPGPRWCTPVAFDVYLDGEFLTSVDPVAPGSESEPIRFRPDPGENTIELRDPRCDAGEGCCPPDGQITSWGGIIRIRPDGSGPEG